MAKTTKEKKDRYEFEATQFTLTGSIQPSNFFFYQTNSNTQSALKPVLIQTQQGYRGTIANYLSDEDMDNALNDDKKSPANANPGVQDACFLSPDCDTLVLKGAIKFINNTQNPTMCQNPKFLAKYLAFVEKYKQDVGFQSLFQRYVMNLLNGKLLWRNKYGFNRSVKLELQTVSGTQSTLEMPLLNTNAVDLDQVTLTTEQQKQVVDFADAMAVAFEQPYSYFLIKVTYQVELGDGATVHPSQLFADSETKKALRHDDKYGKLMSGIQTDAGLQAIFHSQKIGNALRQIDTWYEGADAANPISVESYGSVPAYKEVKRKDKSIFYFIKNLPKLENALFPDAGDNHYAMAAFIKGGLYQTNKSEKATTEEG